jgi:hypothetical protein
LHGVFVVLVVARCLFYICTVLAHQGLVGGSSGLIGNMMMMICTVLAHQGLVGGSSGCWQLRCMCNPMTEQCAYVLVCTQALRLCLTPWFFGVATDVLQTLDAAGSLCQARVSWGDATSGDVGCITQQSGVPDASDGAECGGDLKRGSGVPAGALAAASWYTA